MSNIYTQSNFQDVRNTVDKLTHNRYINSNNPDITGIIPPDYNNMCITNKCNKISDNKEYYGNEFLEQYDDLRYDNTGVPVSKNNTNNTNMEKRMALQDGFSKFDSNNNMTFNVVSNDAQVNFNKSLKPFFRTKKGYGSDNNMESQRNIVNERKNELFTGSINNPQFKTKIENKPLFNPEYGMTNIYGTNVMTDFYEKRYEPNRERRNEKPFEAVRVTPGLNLGANSIAKFGFHETARIMPKTVDDLRNANKPKISYTTPVVSGMKSIRGPIPSKTFKRRPITYHEYDKKWLIEGVGDYRAAAITGKISAKNLATVNRGTQKHNYAGPANYIISQATSENLISKVKNSTRQNYDADKPSNIQSVDYKKGQAVDYNDITKQTQKEDFINTDRVGVINNNVINKNKTFVPSDVMDMTQREIYADNNRAGVVSNSEYNKNTVRDIHDIARMTQREIYNILNRMGVLNSSELSKNTTRNIQDIVKMTQREVYASLDRAGIISNGELNKNKAVDSNDITRMTQREIYAALDRTGIINNSVLNKNKAIDFSDISRMTQREIYAAFDRTGIINNSVLNKNKAIDFSDITRMTQREIYAALDRAGIIDSNETNKNMARNINDIVKMTQREVFTALDRAGIITNNELNKNNVVNFSDIVKMTQREIYAALDRTGVVNNSALNKNKAIDFSDITRMTQREIYAALDRTGIINNSEKNKNTARDIHDIVKMTQREVYAGLDRAGIISNGELNKNKVIDFSDIVKITQREIYAALDRTGVISNSEFNKHKAVDWSDTMRTTQKEQYVKADRTGINGTSEYEQPRTRGDITNMNVNISKENISKGRMPTTSNYEKGPIIDYTMISLCKPLEINRDLYPENRNTAQQRMPIGNTRFPQKTPTDEWHFYTNIEENLKGNPYVNNVIHKSL